MSDLEKARYHDRMQTRERMAEVTGIGAEILRGSNLTIEGTPIGQNELETTLHLIQEIAPVDIDNYRLHAHIQLSAKFARKIGEQLKTANPDKYVDLNLDEVELLTLLHDFGRFTTHKFYRNDIVGELELKNIGIRPDLVSQFPTIREYMKKNPDDKGEIKKTLANLSVVQRIIELSDVHGKRKDDGGISTFDKVMEYHHASRRQSGKELYPSERKTDNNFVLFSEKIYNGLRDWLSDQGVNIDTVREQILQEERDTEIRGVIFDIGNVLIPTPEADFIEDLSTEFGIDDEIAKKEWAEVVSNLQIGRVTQDQMWQDFSTRVSKPLPDSYQELASRKLRTATDLDVEGMVGELKKGEYTVGALSDTIPPHIEKIKKTGLYDKFDVVTLSPDIRVSKKLGTGEAFKIAALKMWLPPQACVFIDDIEEYVKTSEKVGMKGIHFTSGEELRKSLIEKGLLTV